MMVANGLRGIALGVMGAATIAPLFNPALKPSVLVRIAGGLVAGAVEALALRVIGYIADKTSREGGEEWPSCFWASC